jgi:hypothetical protein
MVTFVDTVKMLKGDLRLSLRETDFVRKYVEDELGTEEEGIEEFQVNVHESAKGLLQMVLIICLHMIT